MKFILALLFVGAFSSSLAPALFAQTNDEVEKVSTTLVNVPVVVSDRDGHYISGLKAEDFSVFQDGVEQDIDFFAVQEEPLNVALLLDSSRSTTDVLDDIKDAARDFIELLQPNDKSLVASFDYKVNVLSPLTSDRKTLEKSIKKMDIGEQVGTVMRDAVKEVVERLFAGVKGRKAIILLTDGKDFGSGETKSALLDALDESDVIVYTVFYKTAGNFNRQRNGGNYGSRRGGVFGGGNRRNGGGAGGNFPRRFPNEEKRRERAQAADAEAVEYLQKMSDATAGRFYENEVADLRETFGLITDELRKQYRLGYYPKTENDANFSHRIKVRVNRPNAVVRARANYRVK